MKKQKTNLWKKIFRVFGKWVETSIRQVLIIAVILLGFMHYTGFKFDKKIAQEIDTATPLLSNEDARLVIDTMRQFIAVQKQGKATKVYTGVRKATVTKLDTGEIKLDIPIKGFTLEPGLVLGVGEGLRVGGDIQYAYWRRWGLTAGATVPVQGRKLSLLRGHLGFAYSPYFKYFPNTSVWGGFDTNKKPTGGLRTRF